MSLSASALRSTKHQWKRHIRSLSTTTSGKGLRVMFGSHTGTAANYANTLAMFARVHNLQSEATAFTIEGATQIAKDKETPVAFIVSSYGNGELPPASREAYQWLQDNRPDLRGLSYTIFGLGNSQYDEFNKAAKLLDQALKELGAVPFHKVGLGDQVASEGHQTAFQPWLGEMWGRLGLGSGAEVLPSDYTVTSVGKGSSSGQPAPSSSFGSLHEGHQVGTVESNGHLTGAGSDAEVHLLRIKLAPGSDGYKLWDHVLVQPVAAEGLVQRMVKRLGLDINEHVSVSPNNHGARLGSLSLPVGELLRKVIDISAIPSRMTLASLAISAKDESERQSLERISSDMRPSSFYTKMSTSGVWTLVDVLEQFPSIEVNLAQLLTHSPMVQPRTYSICSDPVVSPSTVEVCYSVHARKADNKHFEGLASGHLKSLKEGSSVLYQVHVGGASVPDDKADVVGVAMGTGIGMFRALGQHRLDRKRAGHEVGRMRVFYGMRKSKTDFLFQEEWQALGKEGIVEMYPTFSHDQERFITPLDRIDELRHDVSKWIQGGSTVAYCGLGGVVPKLIEAAIRQSLEAGGVSDSWKYLGSMRQGGRYLEEFYSRDADVENKMESLYGKMAQVPMGQRFPDAEMFCFQCEQTFNNTGCATTGVCGKSPDVAALQDLVIHGCKTLGWYVHATRTLMKEHPDRVPANKEFLVSEHGPLILYSMFSTLTNVNFDAVRFVAILRDLVASLSLQVRHYKELCGALGVGVRAPRAVSMPAVEELRDDNVRNLVMAGKVVGVLSQYERGKPEAAVGLTELLVYGLKGICAYADHAKLGRFEDPGVYETLVELLGFALSEERFDVQQALAAGLRAGELNYRVLNMLDKSNRQFGEPVPTEVPAVATPGKCILVSGHDLVVLSSLLKAVEGTSIKVYTHGEMLPAHGYPQLRQSGHLYGQFGSAWNRQSIEFPHFPGPIVMTTNCLTEPQSSYKDRLFTFGAVGWKGVAHVGNNPDTVDWSGVIAKANAAPGFGPEDKKFKYPEQAGITRPDKYVVGFGHKTILSHAGTILEEIQKGNISRFFVIGGCDGYEGSRSYFSDVGTNMSKTGVILTMGCGKFRVNHLDLGTIGSTGIPRVLDMGQCNDSFTGVEVAIALANALNCQVSDLPISFVISWFEQKAIACFLTLLHLGLKPIRLGPSLPAFVNADVLDVLVKQFGVLPAGDPADDVKKMEAAKAMS